MEEKSQMELLEMKYVISEGKKQHRWSEQEMRCFRRKKVVNLET